jgi:hypothetical protein
VNGPVYALKEVGDVVYVGGEFNSVTTRFTQYGNTVINQNTGALINGFPEIPTKPTHVVADGRGGWYLFGDQSKNFNPNVSFPAVHVKNDLSLESSWSPRVPNLTLSNSAYISSVCEHGSVFYVSVTYLDNLRSKAAVYKIDKATGLTTSVISEVEFVVTIKRPFEAPEIIYNTPKITALAVNGNNIFLAGDFNRINQVERKRIAQISLSTLAPTSFSINFPDESSQLFSDIVFHGNEIIIGGSIVLAGAQSAVAFIDALGVVRFPTTPILGSANDLEVYGDLLYIGGGFYQDGSYDVLKVDGLRVFSFSTNQFIAWGEPFKVSNISGPFNFISPVSVVKAVGNIVYIAGVFDRVGTTTKKYFVALNSVDGTPLSPVINYPQLNSSARTLSISGTRLYISGEFFGINPVTRNNLLAFNKNTGGLLSWAPALDGPVFDIQADDSRIYIGGKFNFYGTQPRKNVAILNTTNRALRTTRIDTDAPVRVLAVKNNNLFIGGDFTSVNGIVRNQLAAYSFATNSLIGWSPTLTYNQIPFNNYSRISDIKIGLTDVYVSGAFNTVNGMNRNGFASFSLSDLTLTTFNGISSNGISIGGIAIDNNVVYVSSPQILASENSITTTRYYVAAFDDITKIITPFSILGVGSNFPTDEFGTNYDIAVDANYVYLHGASFSTSSIAPTQNSGIIRVSKQSGILSPITDVNLRVFGIEKGSSRNPYESTVRTSGITSILRFDDKVIFGGGISGTRPASQYLAAYQVTTPSLPPVAPLATQQATESPESVSAEQSADSAQVPVVSLQPNPTTGPTTLSLHLAEESKVSISLIGLGSQVDALVTDRTFPAGTYSFPIQAGTGVTQVQVLINGKPYIERIIRY